MKGDLYISKMDKYWELNEIEYEVAVFIALLLFEIESYGKDAQPWRTNDMAAMVIHLWPSPVTSNIKHHHEHEFCHMLSITEQ